MSSDEKRPLGKILLQRKLVSQQELDAALRAQKRAVTPVPLASQLVDEGTVAEVDALRALSEQYGVPAIDLAQIGIRLEDLELVPRELAEMNLILPVLVRGDSVFLAAADPHEKRPVIDELEFVSGKKAYLYIAMQATLMKTIAAAYDAKALGERHYLGPRVPVETLRSLGLCPPDGESAGGPPAPDAAAPGPEVLVDESAAAAWRDAEVSTSEFGVIPDDVSSVGNLPQELRRVARTADEPGETEGRPPGAAPPAGRLILVVDDEPEIRDLLRRLLTQQGLRVIEADAGFLALRMVKEHLPDLIILDATLPELHGFEIARRLKASTKYGQTPIIMVSAGYGGWRMAEDLKQNCGVEEYLEKPFKLSSMLEAVSRLLPAGEGPVASARDPESLSADAEKALRDGIAAYRDGRIDDAIEHLQKGVAIDSLSYRLHFHLALLFGKRGQVYEGIHELERAIELYPKHFAGLKNLAVLYEKAGFKNKALEMWERCLALAPDDATRTSLRDHVRQLI